MAKDWVRDRRKQLGTAALLSIVQSLSQLLRQFDGLLRTLRSKPAFVNDESGEFCLIVDAV